MTSDSPARSRRLSMIASVEAFADVAHHHRRGVEIVGRNVEEALDLTGVQVERHHAVDAGMGDQVGHQLGGNGRARTNLAVLPGVAEIGDHRGDAPRGSPAQRVGDDQKLHQMVVGRIRRRLDDEHVRAADVFLDFDEDFHVGETADDGLGQRQMEPVGDFLRQGRIGVAGDELDGAVLGRHRPFSPRLAGYDVQHIGIPTKKARFNERGDIKEVARLATRRIRFSCAKSPV
jgi:hypothetical protein